MWSIENMLIFIFYSLTSTDPQHFSQRRQEEQRPLPWSSHVPFLYGWVACACEYICMCGWMGILLCVDAACTWLVLTRSKRKEGRRGLLASVPFMNFGPLSWKPCACGIQQSHPKSPVLLFSCMDSQHAHTHNQPWFWNLWNTCSSMCVSYISPCLCIHTHARAVVCIWKYMCMCISFPCLTLSFSMCVQHTHSLIYMY